MLAVLAVAVLTIKYVVRRKDVLHGGYIKDDEG
jgi:heme exporter protein D